MKILVTGSNGYIGSHLVKILLDKGHQVIACDIASNNIDKRANFIDFDIFNFSNLINLFDYFHQPDSCIHMAWRDGFIHNSQNHILDLSSHFYFLTKLIDDGLRHLAVMGTMHEIGYFEGKIEENTPCNPQSLYGISKNALRQSLMLYINNTNCILQWLRGFYIYGDDSKNHSIFSKLIQASSEGKHTFPFTSGRNEYDFISVDQLVIQISSVILQNTVTGIINCCSGVPVPLGKKVEEFIITNHLNIKLLYGAFPDRLYDSPCVYGDASKILSIMNN